MNAKELGDRQARAGHNYRGMTIREYAAVQIMSGMAPRELEEPEPWSECARYAVFAADALLAALAEKEDGT